MAGRPKNGGTVSLSAGSSRNSSFNFDEIRLNTFKDSESDSNVEDLDDDEADGGDDDEKDDDDELVAKDIVVHSSSNKTRERFSNLLQQPSTLLSPPLPLMSFHPEYNLLGAITVSGGTILNIPNDFGSPLKSIMTIYNRTCADWDHLHDPLRSRRLVKWFTARANKESIVRQMDFGESRKDRSDDNEEHKQDFELRQRLVFEGANFFAESMSTTNPTKEVHTSDAEDVDMDVGRDSRAEHLGADLIFDSNFECGNLDKVYRVTGREGLMRGAVLNEIQNFAIPHDVHQEYDMKLRNDLATTGNIQWYYFSACAPATPRLQFPLRVRFTITNMQKQDALYNYGMKPAVLSSVAAERGWRHGGEDVCYYRNGACAVKAATGKKKKKKKFKLQPYYSLTFTYTFHGPDKVFFAHTFPYTFSDLQRYLLELEKDEYVSSFMRRRTLCTTLGGNKCDLLTITTQRGVQGQGQGQGQSTVDNRPSIIISARVHPGESNASYMMHGILEFLTSDHPHAVTLRDCFVFKIVPMLNPDGVIHGNYRCSLAGMDLNRRYLDCSPDLHPTIVALKNLIKITNDQRGVLFFFDLHGHSKNKNAFLYGCDIAMQKMNQSLRRSLPVGQEQTEARRLHVRLFPTLLAQPSVLSDYDRLAHSWTNGRTGGPGHWGRADGDRSHSDGEGFRPLPDRERDREAQAHQKDVQKGMQVHVRPSYFTYADCNFRVHKSKIGTGRVVAWRDLHVESAYTVELSFCGAGDNAEAKLLKKVESLLSMPSLKGSTSSSSLSSSFGKGVGKDSSLTTGASENIDVLEEAMAFKCKCVVGGIQFPRGERSADVLRENVRQRSRQAGGVIAESAKENGEFTSRNTDLASVLGGVGPNGNNEEAAGETNLGKSNWTTREVKDAASVCDDRSDLYIAWKAVKKLSVEKKRRASWAGAGAGLGTEDEIKAADKKGLNLARDTGGPSNAPSAPHGGPFSTRAPTPPLPGAGGGIQAPSTAVTEAELSRMLSLLEGYEREYHYTKEDYKLMGVDLCMALLKYANIGPLTSPAGPMAQEKLSKFSAFSSSRGHSFSTTLSSNSGTRASNSRSLSPARTASGSISAQGPAIYFPLRREIPPLATSSPPDIGSVAAAVAAVGPCSNADVSFSSVLDQQATSVCVPDDLSNITSSATTTSNANALSIPLPQLALQQSSSIPAQSSKATKRSKKHSSKAKDRNTDKVDKLEKSLTLDIPAMPLQLPEIINSPRQRQASAAADEVDGGRNHLAELGVGGDYHIRAMYRLSELRKELDQRAMEQRADPPQMGSARMEKVDQHSDETVKVAGELKATMTTFHYTKEQDQYNNNGDKEKERYVERIKMDSDDDKKPMSGKQLTSRQKSTKDSSDDTDLEHTSAISNGVGRCVEICIIDAMQLNHHIFAPAVYSSEAIDFALLNLFEGPPAASVSTPATSTDAFAAGGLLALLSPRMQAELAVRRELAMLSASHVETIASNLKAAQFLQQSSVDAGGAGDGESEDDGSDSDPSVDNVPFTAGQRRAHLSPSMNRRLLLLAIQQAAEKCQKINKRLSRRREKKIAVKVRAQLQREQEVSAPVVVTVKSFGTNVRVASSAFLQSQVNGVRNRPPVKPAPRRDRMRSYRRLGAVATGGEDELAAADGTAMSSSHSASPPPHTSSSFSSTFSSTRPNIKMDSDPYDVHDFIADTWNALHPAIRARESNILRPGHQQQQQQQQQQQPHMLPLSQPQRMQPPQEGALLSSLALCGDYTLTSWPSQTSQPSSSSANPPLLLPIRCHILTLGMPVDNGDDGNGNGDVPSEVSKFERAAFLTAKRRGGGGAKSSSLPTPHANASRGGAAFSQSTGVEGGGNS